MELAEKRENGTTLLVEEEYWFDHSDDEADTIETAHMCLIGDDQSDDDETDEDEVISEFDYTFISSQMNIIITALSDLRSKLISEKNLNSENLEEKLFSQKQDSISGLSSDSKENKKAFLKSKNFSQTFSDSEATSYLLVDQLGFLGKIVSSDSNIKSKILDESFTLNDNYYKPKRKRRRSKKSKKKDTVISENSNSSDSILLDRTLSTSSKHIWRVKRTSDDSTTDEDRYVDKQYKSDSFASCNQISKYSIKQMIQISKNVSYSSSDSSSDDYAFSSANSYVNLSDHISCASRVKSYKYFPTRTATNFHGPKFKWVPKSKIDFKLQASNVKGE
ncbi:hypothetical protein L6452_02167 [Arctium lappa]|uniref:Uncharacterized protein n=1 Tax=Arctium lappa TaxID=4217 RepID=A0ACB9FJK2_ARCLA|nr:hypothetical protein L6452_02167 [Arctium lappa]